MRLLPIAAGWRRYLTNEEKADPRGTIIARSISYTGIQEQLFKKRVYSRKPRISRTRTSSCDRSIETRHQRHRSTRQPGASLSGTNQLGHPGTVQRPSTTHERDQRSDKLYGCPKASPETRGEAFIKDRWSGTGTGGSAPQTTPPLLATPAANKRYVPLSLTVVLQRQPSSDWKPSQISEADA